MRRIAPPAAACPRPPIPHERPATPGGRRAHAYPIEAPGGAAEKLLNPIDCSCFDPAFSADRFLVISVYLADLEAARAHVRSSPTHCNLHLADAEATTRTDESD